MIVGSWVNDLNHPDLLFTLRWIFLWFLEGGVQTKIDLFVSELFFLWVDQSLPTKKLK